jgi:hypothetical protein
MKRKLSEESPPLAEVSLFKVGKTDKFPYIKKPKSHSIVEWLDLDESILRKMR